MENRAFVNSPSLNLNPIPQAIILAGGRGTRLGHLTENTPKPLLPVAGRPFIHYVLNYLREHGVAHAVLSVGYLAEQFQTILGAESCGVSLRYAVEETPLGTGGAVQFATNFLPFPHLPFFVLNGDTIFDAPLQSLAARLTNNIPAAIFTHTVPDTARYGAVCLDEKGYVLSLGEKTSCGPGLINAGIYALNQTVLQFFPSGSSSLESDILNKLVQAKSLSALHAHGFFLDIGVQTTFNSAQQLLLRYEKNRHKPLVLLDRDGTLIEEKHYLHQPERVVLLENVPEALQTLQKKGCALVMLTNQSGIGRGYYTKKDLLAVNARLEELLSLHDVKLDALYYCPHRPEEKCLCRKPLWGMVDSALTQDAWSLQQAFVIGDKTCDIDLAINIGAHPVLVQTGYGKTSNPSLHKRAEYVAANMHEAAEWIVNRLKQTS